MLIICSLLFAGISANAQDWIVLKANGDSLTGRILYEKNDTIHLYRILFGDTIVRVIAKSSIKSYQWTFPHNVYIPPQEQYSLSQQVPDFKPPRDIRRGELYQEAKSNLYLSPIPAVLGGGIGAALWYGAYKEAFNYSKSHSPDIDKIQGFQNASKVFFVLGGGIASYMLTRGFIKLHKANKLK